MAAISFRGGLKCALDPYQAGNSPGASVPKTQLIALGVEADNCT
jgi:hypothetical protein